MFRFSALARSLVRLRDLALLDANPEFERLLGLPLADLLGRSDLAFSRFIDADRSERMLAELQATGRATGVEGSFTGPDGARREFTLSSAVFRLDDEDCVVTNFLDVTETRAAQRLVQESEERFTTVFHSAVAPLVIIRINDNIVLELNQACASLIGAPRESLVGTTIPMVTRAITDAKRDRDREELARAGRIEGVESQIVDASGKTHDVLVSAVLAKIASDPCMILSITDITARRKMENALRASQTALLAANKDLDAFTFTVSHDLRAPIRSISGFSKILLEDHAQELGVESKRLLATVMDEAQHMAQLVDDLLAFARLGGEALARAPVEPAALARDIIADLLPASSSHNVNVVVNDMPACEADPSLLRQVYANLLENAIKFSRRREPARIEVGWTADHGGAYYVKDNGVGFDMAHATNIFTVFHRLHKADDFEGTGVGLAICHRIISKHGGRIWADASPKNGATFYFTIGAEGVRDA